MVKFTYDKKQVFEFQKMILIPDQFRFSPSPEHTRFSGKIGGQIKVNTSLALDAATAKTIASTKV